MVQALMEGLTRGNWTLPSSSAPIQVSHIYWLDKYIAKYECRAAQHKTQLLNNFVHSCLDTKQLFMAYMAQHVRMSKAACLMLAGCKRPAICMLLGTGLGGCIFTNLVFFLQAGLLT